MFYRVLKKIVKRLSTESSFLHIMVTHNVEYCKSKLRFIPLTIFHLNDILLLIVKMTTKQFLISFVKNILVIDRILKAGDDLEVLPPGKIGGV